MMEELTFSALKILLVAAGLPLACSALAGLAVATLQAATQLQDQCVGFAARLAAVSLATLFIWRWISSSMPPLFELAFRTVIEIGLRG